MNFNILQIKEKNINKLQEAYSIVPQLVFSNDLFNENNIGDFYTEKKLIVYENFTALLVFESVKNNIALQYSQLICITGINYLKANFDMEIVYELLSFTYNKRLRIKSFTNKYYEIYTISKIYKCAD